MNRNRVMAVGGAVLVAALAWWWISTHRGPETVKYRTAAVEKGDIEVVVAATGTIRPVEQVEVGSQVSGTVSRLAADYNSRVRRGQVLLQLDPASFAARHAQAEAAVAGAEAALREARRHHARALELVRESHISQADVETAEVAVAQREADLKQARAQLQAARVDLDNATIRSPIDGVVIARSVEVGQTVAASLQAPRLFVIANDLTRMQVETRIDEADIGQIRPGLPVTFTVDAFPDQTFAGTVSQVRLEPITEQNVTTYTTVIGTRNPELRLRPGMTANVAVEVGGRQDVIKVPNAALRFRPPAGAGAPGRAVASAGARNGAAPPGAERAGARGRRDSMAPGGGGSRRARRGEAGAPAATLPASGPVVMGTAAAPRPRPATLYVLRNGQPLAVTVTTGLSDGGFTELVAGELAPGDQVIVGTEGGARAAPGTQLPPGMGGGFGGGGGRGGGGGGRR